MERACSEHCGRKIFIASSTVDLIDLRAELSVYLHELGLMPVTCEGVFGDDSQEPGKVKARCILNVRDAHAVVVIVSDRYGELAVDSSLSYTHEEYMEARRWQRPVYFYARQFLWDAYQQWAEGVKEPIPGDLCKALSRWGKPRSREHRPLGPEHPAEVLRILERVPSVKEAIVTRAGYTIAAAELRRLYSFMLSQQCWPEGDKGYITGFDTVVDLKEHLRNDLKAHRLVASFEDLLRAGRLPFIRVDAGKPHVEYAAGEDLYLKVTNVAPMPAAFDSVSGVYFTARDAPTEIKTLYLDDATKEVYAETEEGSRRMDKVEGLDWSPLEPSVLRDNEGRLVCVRAGRLFPSARRLWISVIYQSAIGGHFHAADVYTIDLPQRRQDALRIFYDDKHVLLPRWKPPQHMGAGSTRTGARR